MKKLFLYAIPAVMLIGAFIIIKSQSGLTVSSPEFDNNDTIPIKFTCEGPNVNPELNIAGIPSATRSLAVTVTDADILLQDVGLWLMWNIPVTDTLEENSHPGLQGRNFNGEVKYDGPCESNAMHRYQFKVYALDTKLSLKEGSDKKQLDAAMKNHVLATGELIGLYRMTTYMATPK